MKDYEKNKESSYLSSSDVSTLYERAMPLKLMLVTILIFIKN